MNGLTFPNGPFAFAFVLLLLVPLGIAAWIDYGTLRIPNKLSVRFLLAGLVVSVARGFWLGADGEPVWVLNWPSAVPGAVDGFLFALSGALTGFTVFFGLWTTRIFVGGGDVKLVTATGAWLGPVGVLLAAFFSLGAFTVLGLGRIALELSRGVLPSLAPRARASRNRKARNRISYSLSFLVGVLILLVYVFRVRLGLVPAPR